MEILPRAQNELAQAVIMQNWKAVKRIQNKKELLNTKDEFGGTPLLYAFAENNASLDAEDWERNVAPEHVVKELLKYANKALIELEYEDKYGNRGNILHLLAYYGYPSALRAALEISARNVNKQDSGPGMPLFTPMHYCMDAPHLTHQQRNDTAMVLRLIGASASIKDKDGDTPLDLYNKNPCFNYDADKRTRNKEELKKLLQELLVPAEILQREEEAVNAEICKNGEITISNCRGVGKTSCLRAIVGEKNHNRRLTSCEQTITVHTKVSARTKLNEPSTDDSLKCEMQIIHVPELTRKDWDNLIVERIAERLKAEHNQPVNPNSTYNSDRPSTAHSSSKDDFHDGASVRPIFKRFTSFFSCIKS